MNKRGFVEKVVVNEKKWQGKDTYDAIIDGKKVGFFLDKRILDYENREVEYEEEVKGDFINGKLPKPQGSGEKKPWGGGFNKGKSPEERESIEHQVALKEACNVVNEFIGVNKCKDIKEAIKFVEEIYPAFKSLLKGEK